MTDLTENEKKVVLAALRDYRQTIEEDTGYLSDQECSDILNVIDALDRFGKLSPRQISSATFDANPLNWTIINDAS